MVYAYLLLAGMAVSFALVQYNRRRASPVLSIINRWLRWFILAGGAAWIVRDLEWSDRPYWILGVAFLLLWLLAETLYNWLAISALSQSPLPLFPRFTRNQSGDEWPISPQLMRLRDWLRAQGFKQVQALKAEIGGGIHLRVSVFQDTTATQRLQVTFVPQAHGAVSVCCSLSTETASGARYITDNLFLPFGGFYPENWYLERNPWRRSLPALLRRHQRRLARAAETPVPWTTDPLNDLNNQQQELDRLNTELGFLVPHSEREEHGKMTSEGRYRVWKEIWLLNYLGRSVNYL